jgi:subtilisin-like proprotein convertase family protein
MPVVNVAALRTGLGRTDSKFPATPPQATAADLGRILANNFGLIGTQIARAEAAWLLELGTHPNADAALLSAIAQRCQGVVLGPTARQLGFDQWLTSIGGMSPTPAPTPTPTPTPTGLSGALIPQDATKVVSTASHDIVLASAQGASVLPDLQVKRRDIADPEQRASLVSFSAADVAGVRTAADFKALLQRSFNDNKAFLIADKATLLAKLPAADRSNFAYLNITGRRIEQFFNEAQRELGRMTLSPADAKAARLALNEQYRDAFRGRTADFDRADTGSYWSYGHDAAFVHVFERMLQALPDGDPRRAFIQNQIDFIFANKYVPNGAVNENDIEKSLGLVAIDKASRRVVSMTAESAGANAVRFETLTSGGRAAFRDGDRTFWEGTRTELSAAEVAALVRTPVSQVTFRRAQAGESLRSGLRFDWDKNRMINARDVDTSWWGHCDIKATIETLLADMAGSRGVSEFRTDTKKTTEFTREMQLEALAALLNFDDVYVAAQGAGGARRFGSTDFAGGRNDDRPTSMQIRTDRGQQFELPIRLDLLSARGQSGTLVDVATTFAPKVADANQQSFSDNPDVQVNPNDPDQAVMDVAQRKIGGTTDGYTFDDAGRPVEAKVRFEIDPAATTGSKVLIGTELTDIASRQLQRIYYDPATKELSLVQTSFEQQNGKFTAVEGRSSSLGRLAGLSLSRELEAGDDVQGKLAMLEQAVRTGKKMATDSSTGMQVWNGEIHAIRRNLEWRSPDGRWERESVTIDATFGAGKVGSFLHKLDEEGRIVDTMELRAAVDFYWADNPRVAPLISERGNWFVNKAMLDRGVVDLGAGKAASLGMLQDLSDLVYLGLKAKDGKKLFTIVDQGKRYVYEDENAWRADVARLQAAGPANPGNEGGVANRVLVSRQPNLAVPDADPTGVTDTVSVTTTGTIKSVKVDIDLKHSYIGDLDVALVAPDGTQVKLHARGGRNARDITGTYGNGLRSVDDLAKLVGKAAAGDWKLKVVDLEGQDVGSLVSWGLQVEV